MMLQAQMASDGTVGKSISRIVSDYRGAGRIASLETLP